MDTASTTVPSTNTPPLVMPEAEARVVRKRLIIALIAFILLVIIGLLAGFLPRWHRRTVFNRESATLAVPVVSIISPSPGKAVAGLSLPAEVKPYLEASIYARASGYLTKVLVDIGQEVQEGQLLAEIDTPELNQELARSRAELAQAEASLGLSQKTAARWADLLKSSSVSDQEAAEKQSDLALKSATRDAAQASVRRLEDLQSFQHVTAPFAGTVVARLTDVGALIGQNSGQELFRLAQTKTLRVYVRVPQTAAMNIKAGQLVDIRVPELPGQTLDAKVVRTSGMVSSDSRTVLTELALDNKEGKVLAGSYVQARFKEASASTALTLPASTLLFRAEGTQVGVVDDANRVTLHNITLGRDFGSSFEVLNGIAPEDKVIANPPDALVSGMTVRIASATEPVGKP